MEWRGWVTTETSGRGLIFADRTIFFDPVLNPPE